MKTSELAGISRDFRETASGFLCPSDCMAKREEFDNRELCYLSSFEEHKTYTILYSMDKLYYTLHPFIFVASVAPETPFFVFLGITGVTD